MTYSDFVAERADAFGNLARKLVGLGDDEIRALGLTMLRAIVRSIKTPPDATLSEVPKG